MFIISIIFIIVTVILIYIITVVITIIMIINFITIFVIIIFNIFCCYCYYYNNTIIVAILVYLRVVLVCFSIIYSCRTIGNGEIITSCFRFRFFIHTNVLANFFVHEDISSSLRCDSFLPSFFIDIIINFIDIIIKTCVLSLYNSL